MIRRIKNRLFTLAVTTAIGAAAGLAAVELDRRIRIAKGEKVPDRPKWDAWMAAAKAAIEPHLRKIRKFMTPEPEPTVQPALKAQLTPLNGGSVGYLAEVVYADGSQRTYQWFKTRQEAAEKVKWYDAEIKAGRITA